MDAYREAVEQALLQFPLLMQQGDEPVTQPQEGGWEADMPPQPLRSAMRYSLLLPGKRLRPCCCWPPTTWYATIGSAHCPLPVPWK